MTIAIVTDSGARFSNMRLVQQYPLTVAPYKIDVGGRQYREDIDLTADEIMGLIKANSKPPNVVAPDVQDYLDIYNRLLRGYDHVISIHTSRELTRSWYNAREAAQQVGDDDTIVVIDTRTICAGQAMLVKLAADSILKGDAFEDVIQTVRKAVDRVFSVYYVDSLDYLQHNEIFSEARAILGTMLGIKPFLAIEEGKAIVTEKVKSRSQAIDRMVEFLVEFDEIDDAAIVQNRQHITEQARLLQDRLSVEFPGKHFPYSMYGLALASLFGGDATGVVVLETELEGFDDEF